MKYLFLIAWHQLAYCLLHAGLIASACGIPALQLLIAPPLLAPQHCAGFTTGRHAVSELLNEIKLSTIN